MHIEAQEIYELTGTVNLRLVSILTLTKHSCAIHIGPIFASEQVCRFKKNISTVFPVQICPVLSRFQSGLNCLLHMTLIARMKISQRMCDLVWRMNGLLLTRTNLISTDEHRDVRLLLLQFR